MKTKTLAAIALTSLIAAGGSAFAADTSHDGYNRGFYGTSGTPAADTMGKAAYGTPSTTSPWSGHEAYARGLYGSYAKPQMDTMGKAAFGAGSSSIDGLAAYRNAFPAD